MNENLDTEMFKNIEKCSEMFKSVQKGSKI